ncbi:Leucine-rich repeat-containing protein 40 [Dictyocoela muelleri]|nr:Leucine-rich repeat-containing protein 40 [Dictyocoela muelleri]
MGNTCCKPKRIPIARYNTNAREIIKKYEENIENLLKIKINIHTRKLDTHNIKTNNNITDDHNSVIFNSVSNNEKDDKNLNISTQLKYDHLKKILKIDKTEIYYAKYFGAKLDLCRHNVIEIVDEIKLLENIYVIHICCNYLVDLPPGIGDLKKLTVLNLSHNKIFKLPDEIGKLVNLKELNLGYNKLESLPYTITSLKKLEILNIENNNFKELQPAIGRLQKLRRFNFSSNQIKTVPLEIMKLNSLIEIFYRNCQLKLDCNVELPLLSLEELCARKIMDSKLPIHKNISQFHINMFKSCKECSFCLGTAFTTGKYNTLFNFMNYSIPISHTLCKNHFKNCSERVKKLFIENSGKRLGDGFIKPDSLYDFINPYNLSKKQIKEIEKSGNENFEPISSISLKQTVDKLDLDEKIKKF